MFEHRLLPVIFATGQGSDVAKGMAWPVIDGMTVDLQTLFGTPVVHAGFKEFNGILVWMFGIGLELSN